MIDHHCIGYGCREFVVLDTETCGFTGPIVLIQWCVGENGEIHLFSPMRRAIRETLELIEFLIRHKILGFNLAFDIFKIQQCWTTLKLLGRRVGLEAKPIDHVELMAECEVLARDGPCLKPAGALDLMLHARKGPWQSLMARDDVVVRKVPVQIAQLLADELEERVKLPDIFFAKKRKKRKKETEEEHQERMRRKWRIRPVKTASGPSKDFVNIILKFDPSSALKALATQELNLDPKDTLLYSDVELDKKLYPKEHQFAPFACALGRKVEGKWDWQGAWPDKLTPQQQRLAAEMGYKTDATILHVHDEHWATDDLARNYAGKDITYPCGLYIKWGRPAFDDDDSILACLSGSARWKGYSVDPQGISQMEKVASVRADSAPRAPAEVLSYIKEVMSIEEKTVLIDKKTGHETSRNAVLEEVKKLPYCDQCMEGVEHEKCELREHPAAKRAAACVDARHGKKDKEVCEKLLTAMRLHASVNVTGAKSGRQSGGTTSEGKRGRKSSSINPHGVQKKKEVREKFPLAWTEAAIKACGSWEAVLEWAEILELEVSDFIEILVGGDFDAFEVNIADAYYDDPVLREELLKQEIGRDGKPAFDEDGQPIKQKIHAVIGVICYPHGCKNDMQCEQDNPRCPTPNTYWTIRDTEKLAGKLNQYGIEIQNLYTKAKSGLFAIFYFGNEFTLETKLNIRPGDGAKVLNAILGRFKIMGQKRMVFFEDFCPLRQPQERGKVYWVEPKNEVKSMLGFTRTFEIENQVIRAIYDLADDLPETWLEIKTKVIRKDRQQTVANAVRSALFAAAFALQGANTRAAGNHVIQATGAGLTKILQRRLWNVQPCGIHPWIVRPLNVHDELMTACHFSVETKLAKIQADFITEYKSLVPLLGMKWKRMISWAGK